VRLGRRRRRRAAEIEDDDNGYEDYDDNGYEEEAQLESNFDVETQSIRSGEEDGTPGVGNGAGQGGGEHYKEQLALLEELTKENEELERVIAHQQGTRTASATGPRTRSAGKLDVNELPEYKQGQAYEGKQQLFKVVRDDNDRCSVSSRTD